MVVTVSHLGYVKRVPLSTYRAQRRGGKGRSGMQTRDEDFVSRLFVASTHTPVLFFSSHGRVYKEKVWRLPQAAPQARGKALINILPLEQGETITTIMPLPEDESDLGQARRDVRHHARHGAAQQAVRFRRRAPLRHHRHEARRGRGASSTCRSAPRRTTCCSPPRGGQCIRFAVDRRARVPGPHLDGRARHHARRRRQGDLAVDPAPCRGHRRRARGLSQARQRGAARRRTARPRSAATPRRREEAATGAIELGEQRYVEMSAAEQFVLTISEKGYRQAHVVLRVPDHRPRRQRHRRHGDRPTKTGRLVASFPVEESRPDHAGHRRRPADPHARSTASASPAARPRA